jgi:hypothetical protein
MTATEMGRRSDALMYGTLSRRELCDLVARRESRAAELEAELARLRDMHRKSEISNN